MEPFPARGSGSEAQLCCSTGSIAGFLVRVSPRRPPAHPPESSGQPSPALSVWYHFSQDRSFHFPDSKNPPPRSLSPHGLLSVAGGGSVWG